MTKSITFRHNLKSTTWQHHLLLSSFIVTVMLGLASCKINSVSQPSTARPNDTVAVELNLTVSNPDASNPTRGILGMLVPDDWQLLSGNYSSPHGSGRLVESSAWTDSVNVHYPPANSGDNLKWIVCLSDTGYTASAAFDVIVDLSFKVGEREGLFNTGYLFTKAATGMLGTSSTAISYPHQIGIPDSTSFPEFNPWKFAVTADYDWETLFDRTSGWTGSDGTYSIPLSGKEVYTESEPESTLFLWGDTFLGNINDQDLRINNILINNTVALLESRFPDASKVKFEWDSNYGSIFIPNTPNSAPGDWYWPMDGMAIGDSVHTFFIRMHPTGTGQWDWGINGVILISFVPNSTKIVPSYTQREVPLIYNESSTVQSVFGGAILPMTETSGNQNPDGYIYVYGIRSYSSSKELLVARVPEDDFTDFSKYTFYNGSDWVADISQSAPLTERVSQEFSISQLPNGQFILVFQLDTMSESVAIRIGNTPVGPFSLYRTIYTCPEVAEYSAYSAVTYCAKAHPHLSKPGELLISYNVNTIGNGAFDIGDIYHPRFINIKFGEDEIVATHNEKPSLAESFHLKQNYPNPFNATTCIAYRLVQPAEVILKIYDLNGRTVRNLVQNRVGAGTHQVIWNGADDGGRSLPSGVYFAQIQIRTTNQKVINETRKMMLLK
ncbi:MAG: DUF4185 domain-containing protein [Candidatus Neomarinimicrobiota bacterium]